MRLPGLDDTEVREAESIDRARLRSGAKIATLLHNSVTVLGRQPVDNGALVDVNREHHPLTPRNKNSIGLRCEAHAAKIHHIVVGEMPLCQATSSNHMHALRRQRNHTAFVKKNLPYDAFGNGMGSNRGIPLQIRSVERSDSALWDQKSALVS